MAEELQRLPAQSRGEFAHTLALLRGQTQIIQHSGLAEEMRLARTLQHGQVGQQSLDLRLRLAQLFLRRRISLTAIDELLVVDQCRHQHPLAQPFEMRVVGQFLIAELDHLVDGLLGEPELRLGFLSPQSFAFARPIDQGSAYQRSGGDDKQQHDGRAGDRRMPPQPFAHALEESWAAGENGPVFDEAAQGVGEFASAGVAVDGALGDRLQNDGLQLRRHAPVDGARRSWLVVQDLVQQTLVIFAVEHWPKRQQFVESCAERIDVGARVEGGALAGGLFRAHIAQRAEQVAGACEPGPGVELGQAEIGDPDVAQGIHHEVRRLHVAVDDTELMGVLERLGGLYGEPGDRAKKTRRSAGSLRLELGRHGGDRRRTLGLRDNHFADAVARLGRPQLLDQVGEVLPFDELHRIVMNAALAAHAVDRDDIGVVQLGRRLRLVLETLQLSGVERRRER